jgi:DNA (cytosine-5)-methyltransferase 1
MWKGEEYPQKTNDGVVKVDTTSTVSMQEPTIDYSTKTREELIAICKEKGIKGYSGKKKGDLVEILSPKPSDDATPESLLQRVIAGTAIETTELYQQLCSVNKFDHSTGVYYTNPEFFTAILNKVDINIHDKTTTLDFCCGTGNLFMSYLDLLKTKHNDAIIRSVIRNAVFIDIDEAAITVFKLKLYCWIKNNSLPIAVDEYIHNFRVSDGLLDIAALTNTFSIVLSNPPFINLKSNVGYKKKLKDLKYYHHSVSGMMDTYIVSIERITSLLEDDGHAIVICPSQLLTNISCFDIRKHILDTLSIENVFRFPEKTSVFPNITQSICVVDITRAQSKNIHYHTCEYNGDIVVNNSKVLAINRIRDNEYSIIPITDLDSEFIDKLKTFPKLKSYQSIVKCGRGNIDVTLDKPVITAEKTEHPLVRGRTIQSLDSITEYISSKTVQEKKINITNRKLVCQQICNMNSQNRLTFTILDATFVISNSCNYIMVDDRYIHTMNHILNSNVIRRYFDLFSGNNHVSINELNNLPLPDIFDSVVELENMSACERETRIYELYALDNEFVSKYFGTPKAVTIYNHVSQKLSNLELTMSSHIKPGGNWKDIPITITASKRLTNIRKTGGRTTLYGRLDYTKPGFTITAQFSRLPNSSNLHPAKDRMITVREAGIIQSFPLDFKFSDNKNSAIKQIGNAVPPILARFIAGVIKNDIINKNTLDLFSGVGGMSIGFSQEGFAIVVSNELDAKLANEKENTKYHKNTTYVIGDICDSKVKDRIKEALEGVAIGVIIGGPPCQGFSLAGNRDSEDKRNKLYVDYFDMIERYKPECFVMENVKGILSMKNEKKQLVIDEIKGIATTLGYKVSIFKLNACDFAVPQKRERVFIIGHIHKQYDQPLPVIKKEKYISIRDAIGFLEPYEESVGFELSSSIISPYVNYLSDTISLQALYKSYS